MTSAQSVIAAMITPALLILASGSLIATALVRLARVVDRSRVLLATVDTAAGADVPALRSALALHQRRAAFAGRSVAFFFLAVIAFVAGCLFIGIERVAGDSVAWIPISLTIAGMLTLIAGAGYMVAESRLSARQIAGEISHGLALLSARV